MLDNRMFTHNPFTGQPRHLADIESDPQGILITDPNAPLMGYDPEIKQVPELWMWLLVVVIPVLTCVLFFAYFHLTITGVRAHELDNKPVVMDHVSPYPNPFPHYAYDRPATPGTYTPTPRTGGAACSKSANPGACLG